MSAGGEVERLAADLTGAGPGDEEEEWLYGDENEDERPEETPAGDQPPSGNEEEATTENGVVKTKVTDAEDDSDSDSDDDEDDVQVTIGDIKTGAPQYGYGAAPVNLNIKTGGRSFGSSGAKVKGVDLDAPGSINGVPLLEVDLDSFEDKPWRKPGADLSDYFNYGFNEDTWKAYCEKQKRIRMGLENLPVTSTTNKITVQQGRTGNMEKEISLPPAKAEFASPPPLFKTGIPSNRSVGQWYQTCCKGTYFQIATIPLLTCMEEMLAIFLLNQLCLNQKNGRYFISDGNVDISKLEYQTFRAKQAERRAS